MYDYDVYLETPSGKNFCLIICEATLICWRRLLGLSLELVGLEPFQRQTKIVDINVFFLFLFVLGVRRLLATSRRLLATTRRL